MQSNAKDVTTYIEEAPAERQDVLKKLRELCKAHLPGFTENLEYRGPTYSRNGEAEVGFASRKHFIGLYTLRVRTDVMKTHRDQLEGKGVRVGKVPSVIRSLSALTSRWLKASCVTLSNPTDPFVSS